MVKCYCLPYIFKTNNTPVMDNSNQSIISVYDLNSSKFFDEYESISFKKVHANWITEVIPSNGLALDIGAGSGRDAAYLAEKGYSVFAVEPSDKLRLLAQQKHSSKKIAWLKSSLPELKSVFKLKNSFDLILLSAVWMHIAPADRQTSLNNIFRLLNDSGYFVITLRHGNSPDERKMFEITSEEVIDRLQKYSVELVRQTKDIDALKRRDVWWETLVFKKSPK